MTVKPCNVLLVAPKFLRESFFSLQASCKVARARYPAAPLSLMTVAALLPTQWACRLIDHNIDDVTDADIAWADLVMTGGMITQRFGCLDFIARVQAAGKPVAVGGPDVTGSPHLYAQADFIVIGEAEVVIKDFIADWENGQRRGTYKAEKFKIDVTRTPVPRYDLIRHRDYLYLNVQFSRGCPFTCEFCDIIELYGRVPRVKTPQQLIGELEAIYRVGYRGHVDFVDDNFIGNKKAVKAFLPHLIAWQKKRKYPFEFSTEASANLADDKELLAMMREANFFFVFVGIESPDTTTLVSMQKKQNTRRVLADSIHKIYRAGMFVNAGFIVGFDTEKDSVAEDMVRCIEDTSIPVSVVGLLYALPNTQLTTRLRREQRAFPEGWEADALRDGRNDQCSAGLNFETSRPRRDILSDLRTVLDRIYAPGAYFARVRHVMGELDRFRPPNKSPPKRRSIGGVAIVDLLLLLGFVAVKHPRLWLQFARTILFCLVKKPLCMKSAVILSIMYLHIGPFSRSVMAALDRQIELIDRDEWQSPLALPHDQVAAPSIAATAEAASPLRATAETAA
jgi:radical SAM superfamily enzyme YgiQ (UPF0313 family)